MIGINDYCFDNKNMWRVRAWSRIAARVKKSGKVPRDCLVLYLAGKQDLDRRLALRHGFAPHNLVAVEIEEEKREALRETGTISIRGDVDSVLVNWTHDRKIDVALLDYCCGLEERVVRLMTFLNVACSDQAAILVNMQRGRDASTGELRRDLNESALVDQVILQTWPKGDRKHRGMYLIAAMLRGLRQVVLDRAESRPARSGDQLKDPDSKIALLLHLLRPDFLSYRSNLVTMDSVIFTAHRPVLGLLGRLGDDLMFEDYKTLDERAWMRKYENRSVIRSTAAAMAVRTRRA